MVNCDYLFETATIFALFKNVDHITCNIWLSVCWKFRPYTIIGSFDHIWLQKKSIQYWLQSSFQPDICILYVKPHAVTNAYLSWKKNHIERISDYYAIDALFALKKRSICPNGYFLFDNNDKRLPNMSLTYTYLFFAFQTLLNSSLLTQLTTKYFSRIFFSSNWN